MDKRIHFRKTLYFRMLVVTILLGLMFFGGILCIYKISRSRFEEELEHHSNALTAQICQNIEISLKELGEKTVPLTATNEKLAPLLDESAGSFRRFRIQNHLDELLSMQYDIHWIAVIDYDNEGYLAGRNTRSRELLPKADWLLALYQENLQNLNSRPGNMVWLASDNPDSIILMRLIFDSDRMEFKGALMAELENRTLQTIFKELDSSRAGDFILYDRNRNPIFTTAEGIADTEVTDTKDYLYKEYMINEGKLQIIHIIDLKEKNQTFSDLLYLISGIGLLLFIVIIIFLWLMFGKTAKNLKILLGNIDRISAGDFELEHRLSGRGDELDILAFSIQQMSGRIKRLMGQVVREKEIQQQKEYKLLEARYQELQAQVNPHFLFNILQSINGIAQLNGDGQVSQLICKLSKFFRGNIDRRRVSCELNEELEYVKNYMELYQQMYPDRLLLEWQIAPELLRTSIPTHILQPIVENSLVHGMEPMIGLCTVRISACEKAGRLILQVWDNGMGIPPAKLEGILSEEDSVRRIGIKNVKERIQLLYGSEFGISISSEYQRYTEVTLTLPLS